MKDGAEKEVLAPYLERLLAAAHGHVCNECHAPLIPDEVGICGDCIEAEALVQNKEVRREQR